MSCSVFCVRPELASVIEDQELIRGFLRRNSTRKSVRGCGLPIPSSDGDRGMGLMSGKRPGFCNVALCRSSFCCPFCARKIAETRRDQVRGVLDGTCGSFVTLTVAHHKRDSLKAQLDLLMDSWKAVSNAVQIDGVPWIRVLEIRRGVNGWHGHLHVILIGVDPAMLIARGRRRDTIEDGWLISSWCRNVRKRGGVAVPEAQCIKAYDCSEVAQALYPEADLPGYMAKELTFSERKPGESESPWNILEDAANEWACGMIGRQCKLWREYEDATEKRPWCRFSKGLLAELEDDDEGDTVDVAGDEVEADQVVAWIPSSVAFKLTPKDRAQLRQAAYLDDGETVEDAEERLHTLVSDNLHYVRLQISDGRMAR